MIRVALVDDQKLVRAGFRMVIDSQPDLEVVIEADDGQDALDAILPAARAGEVDVVLMDIRMPRIDGIGATERLTAAGELPRVIVLTTFDLDEYVFAAIRAGASGFQIAPSIADDVAQLTIYQRTAQWMFPNPLYHEAVAPGMTRAVQHLPFYGRWYRFLLFWPACDGGLEAMRIDPDYPHQDRAVSEVNDAARERRGVPGNLFVPVNLLKPILADLRANGRRSGPAQPWLGITTEVVQGNLIVAKVAKDGPADRAGLMAGDVIVGVGSETVTNQPDFYRYVWKLGPAGVTVPLRVLKSGDVQEVAVKSADRMATLRKPKGV